MRFVDVVYSSSVREIVWVQILGLFVLCFSRSPFRPLLSVAGNRGGCMFSDFRIGFVLRE